MRVLIGCEFSGVVRDAFRARGHDAWSCDLEGIEPEGKWLKYHLYGDVRWYLHKNWDLFIVHPPCTFLANSGVRWLYGGKGTKRDPVRWRKMCEAAAFFKDMLDAPIECIAAENPIMHGYAQKLVGRNYDQLVQPWMFGHGESKATCFWLKNLSPLTPTRIVKGRNPRVHYASPGPDRWKERSRTLSGIAAAMAVQWGSAP